MHAFIKLFIVNIPYEMLGRVYVWLRIAELKVVGQKKFGM